MCINRLNRLPFEVVQIREPGERAPDYQLALALAMVRIDAEDAAGHLRRQSQQARTPPKWRKIHSQVDRAWKALDQFGET